MDANPPSGIRYMKRQQLLWSALVLLPVVLFFVSLRHISNSKSLLFDKVKQSRRGAIRKARERKQPITFQQERKGVSRSIWIPEENGTRRQFFLLADRAIVDTTIGPKTALIKETFASPCGWLQEELFWEVSTTGEQVLLKGGHWVRASNESQQVPRKNVELIRPMQKVRFFSAETAEWDPQKNVLTAHAATFKIVRAEGHEVSQDFAEKHDKEAVVRGTARALVFAFDKKGGQQVNCQGVKIRMNKVEPHP